MLAIISPAKSLDFSSEIQSMDFTQPKFIKKSSAVVKVLRELKLDELGELLGVSQKLAILNRDRILAWKTPPSIKKARPAIYAYAGDVYEGIHVQDLTEKEVVFLQERLRIISGLYGLLRPLDLIQPYRLEMSAPLAISSAKNLYSYWGEVVTEEIKDLLEQVESSILVNLASGQYSKTIDFSKLSGTIISPAFKEERSGEVKQISLFAKRARGLMVRFIAQHRVTSLKELIQFEAEGYSLNRKLSTALVPVFTRRSQVASKKLN